MAVYYPPSTVSVRGHSVHGMLDHFPIACFTLALLTDIAYWRSANLMWQHFSEWLLFAGLVIGGFAFLFAIIDVAVNRELRATGLAWPYLLGTLVVLALATLNSFVHAADGWVGVVPWGLALSALTVFVLILTAWFGREMIYRTYSGDYAHV